MAVTFQTFPSEVKSLISSQLSPSDREKCQRICQGWRDHIRQLGTPSFGELERIAKLWETLKPISSTALTSSARWNEFLHGISVFANPPTPTVLAMHAPETFSLFNRLQSERILYTPAGFKELEQFAKDVQLCRFFDALIDQNVPNANPPITFRDLLEIAEEFKELPISEQVTQIRETQKYSQYRTMLQEIFKSCKHLGGKLLKEQVNNSLKAKLKELNIQPSEEDFKFFSDQLVELIENPNLENASQKIEDLLIERFPTECGLFRRHYSRTTPEMLEHPLKGCLADDIQTCNIPLDCSSIPPEIYDFHSLRTITLPENVGSDENFPTAKQLLETFPAMEEICVSLYSTEAYRAEVQVISREELRELTTCTNEVLVKRINTNPLKLVFIPKTHPNYLEIARAAVQQHGRALKFVPTDHQNYLEIALAVVQTYIAALQLVPANHPNYLEIARAAVQQNGRALKFVPTTYSKYAEIALAAVQNNYLALQFVPTNHPDYLKIALAAVQKDVFALQHVLTNHPDYLEIALTAVRQDGFALQFVPTTYSKYAEIALTAVRQNVFALKFVPKDHPNYLEIAHAAVQQNGHAFQHVPTTYSKYAEIALASVQNDYLALRFVPTNHPDYLKIALAAAQKNVFALQHVPTNHPNYLEIAIAAVQQNGLALQFIPTDHQNYLEIALSAVRQNDLALHFVPTKHPDYLKIALAAVQKDVFALRHVPTNHPDYLEIARAAEQKKRTPVI